MRKGIIFKMKILYLKNTRENHIDIIETLKKRKHILKIEKIPNDDTALLKKLTEQKDNSLLRKLENGKWDMVFTIDYYPCVSMICESMKIRYVSWIMEPPFSVLYSSTILNSVNLIFVTDKWLVANFRREGIGNIFYLSEGVNLERCNQTKKMLDKQNEQIECSLIGNTRIVPWQEVFQTEHLLDATLGYLEGTMISQNLVFGLDFFAEGLPDYLYKDLMRNSRIRMRDDSVQSIQQFYAEQCFYPRTSAADRDIAAKILSKSMTLNLYTDNEGFEIENIKNCGRISYEERFEIMGKSLLNVCIAPRGLRDGIYGQAIQIMGMRGFLICDYREELAENFVPGEEIIIYEDRKQLVETASYYLEHPKEREKIAQRAFEKVQEKHQLEQRIIDIEKKVELYE